MKIGKTLLYIVSNGFLLGSMLLASEPDIRQNLDNGSNFCYATSSLQAYADYLEYKFARHDYAYKAPMCEEDSVKLKNQKKAYAQVCQVIDYIKKRSKNEPDLDNLLTLISSAGLNYKKGCYNDAGAFLSSLFYFLEIEEDYIGWTKEEIAPGEEREKPALKVGIDFCKEKTTEHFENFVYKGGGDMEKYFKQRYCYDTNDGKSGIIALMNPKDIKSLIAIEDAHGSVHRYKLMSGLFSTPNYASHFIAFVRHKYGYRIYDSLDHDRTNQLHDLPSLAKIIEKEINAPHKNKRRTIEKLFLVHQKIEEEEIVCDIITNYQKSEKHRLDGVFYCLGIVAFGGFFAFLLSRKKYARTREKSGKAIRDKFMIQKANHILNLLQPTVIKNFYAKFC